MKILFIILSLMVLSSGLMVKWLEGENTLKYMHILSAFFLLSIFLLYSSDHIWRKRAYFKSLNFPMVSGVLLYLGYLSLFFSGMILFLWSGGGADKWRDYHYYSALVGALFFAGHWFSKKFTSGRTKK